MELKVDGAAVTVPQGSTLLDACRAAGVEVPTLCYLETLTPVNACRRLRRRAGRRAGAGAGLLAPGRGGHGGGDRLGAGASGPQGGPRAARLLGRPVHRPRARRDDGGLRRPSGALRRRSAATAAQPVKDDNDLYVRDYAKCVLCYKCVEACGVDAQNTFAIAVAGRGFDAHISTELDVPLPESACVYCGNCIAVCPTGALMAKPEYELRRAGAWAPERQTTTDTICGYCGVGCTLTVHVQDDRIVKATSPLENQVTHGNLCVKGRFGFEFVQIGQSAGSRTS